MPEATPTPQAPAAAEPATQPAPAVTVPAATPAAEVPAAKTPPWGTDENFNPEKAWELIENLRKEKTPDTKALETKLADMQAATEARNKALGEALGLTETPKSEDDLAETVKSLQEQFQTSQREAQVLRVAASKGVPPELHHLLTETDTEKLNAQAEMAAEYARLKAAADGTPQFQPNPGQGQGGTPTKTEDDATYEALFGAPPK